MSGKTDILARISGSGGNGISFLPDLTLWMQWHEARETLPEAWQSFSLADISGALGFPVWDVARPWRIETPGVEIKTLVEGATRTAITETSAGRLTARWVRGPDGAWWQTEHPVKTAADVPAALELVRGRTYAPDETDLIQAIQEVSETGVVALEIPSCPYADLMYEFVGQSEGLMLLMEFPPELQELAEALEANMQLVVEQVARLPGELVLAPDNLDGQFISPPVFAAHLHESYARTADLLHHHEKQLVVHAGGAVAGLLVPLAAAGVDAVEGVCGGPQSDASLLQARQIAGAELALWGGIPQDALLEVCEPADFEAFVIEAAREAASGGKVILGVADKVPVDADLARLAAIPGLTESALAA